MKEIWEWKTFWLGWSVVWRALWWGGIPMAVVSASIWPPRDPWSIASIIVWIGGWGIMAEGISVRLAMKKWSGRLTL